ncbi:hypothetical protein LSH36_1599g00011 [Paralvinella palmiformis]|uniref:alpha-amylase n=1 Tax=Paralvinella palmiformis TaxID=53620 RepID=A0AAD9MMK0_9ANNE|nr:hypothetical protein LSH36_1599g00011 [Paralvinella palmiformis]
MMAIGRQKLGMVAKLSVLFLILVTVALDYDADNCQEARTVIVHLFNWKWTDVARECEQFLGPLDIVVSRQSSSERVGVVLTPSVHTVPQSVSPPNEHRIIKSPFRPWWERYQPVSYLLQSRGGNRQQFVDMVHRCGAVGVRIYVDVVINHMTGAGGTGNGSAGTPYNADECCLNFPTVPYSKEDFSTCNCGDCCTRSCDIENYQDSEQLSSERVQDKIAHYLNDLLSIGVAGFRVDASKHMWPSDLEIIFAKMTNSNEAYFPPQTKPFIYCEVIDVGGEPIAAKEYTGLGRVTEFKYSYSIGDVFRNRNDQKLSYLVNFGEAWGFLHSADALVFVDNHDNQRGHGAGGASILTYKDAGLYKRAVTFMLAHPYGFVRIMSSFTWINDWHGPPSNVYGEIDDVIIDAFGACSGGWVCEHRWRQIANMVRFRNVVIGEPIVYWWDNGQNQIAFSRGTKGFLIINGDNYDLNGVITTGLPAGTYCDVISGNLHNGSCTGRSISVSDDGRTFVYISHLWTDPMIAVHEFSRFEFQEIAEPHRRLRTVILIYYRSVLGQDLFIRGGVNPIQNCGSCVIPINHNPLGNSSHYDKYNTWRIGDSYLDWYGEHYWMVDVNMDCSVSFDGWFEFKAFVVNGDGWEPDMTQMASCYGSAGGSRPSYRTRNHVARCGYINVFAFGENSCMMNRFIP